jgi:hypothetical protein
MFLQDIVDQIKTFLFAGHDTTATLLSFAVAMVGQHPHIEQKLHQEVDRVLAQKADQDITPEDISQLHYIKMILKETLRKFPPGSTSRMAPIGYKLGDHEINFSSTHLLIMPYAIHHHPKYWNDPQVFDPERFSPERSKGRHPLAWIPFLTGNRNCIGQDLAILEATVVLAMLARRFYFRLGHGRQCLMKYQVTNVPVDGMRVYVHRRQDGGMLYQTLSSQQKQEQIKKQEQEQKQEQEKTKIQKQEQEEQKQKQKHEQIKIQKQEQENAKDVAFELLDFDNSFHQSKWTTSDLASGIAGDQMASGYFITN